MECLEKYTYNEISNIIFNIFASEGIHFESTENSFAELGVDSIMFVTIIIELEDTLNISFSDNIPLMSECETVNELIEKTIDHIHINN